MTEPVVRTTSGQVRGEQVAGVSRFLGVPYAAGPVRFAAPAPAPAWPGVRDARRPGPTAPQNHREFPGLDASVLTGTGWRPGPDYLCADVWTSDTGAGGLPVMVFVHGGAFVGGTGSASCYDGAAFARNGVVLVTINYRLGIEGWLPVDGAPANLGLLDQIAALRWVRDNAAAFGGDPDNLTVFGESAGAVSVACLLRSPLAQGLFRRAIVQSGHAEMVHAPEQAKLLTEHVAGQLGVAPTAEALRTVPVQRLLAVQEALAVRGPDLRDASGAAPAHGIASFLPVLDEESLPERAEPSTVDLIVGSCAEEMRLYLVPTGMIDALDEQQAIAMLARTHPEPEAELRRHGLGTDGRSPGEVLSSTMTDLVFADGARRLAAEHAGRAFCYEFGWRSPQFGGRLGACHGVELPFVFDNLAAASGPRGLVGERAPQELATQLNRAWVEFAHTGRPGEVGHSALTWRHVETHSGE
ncbi:carboxylesterase family protein [Kutzneria viridogrisea]|uniref:Carboxylic ester hydrolase n=1 Tax=Kutzneria viridogrisea TaxID=47990 RepID=A0ABR6B864_9PSEU|nr:para-nitrobenzyl esterase [Kutzneria viridogrisea]